MFAFYYKKFLASVIRYTTTIMDPPSHTGLFALVHKLSMARHSCKKSTNHNLGTMAPHSGGNGGGMQLRSGTATVV